jgi:hypothetical protein
MNCMILQIKGTATGLNCPNIHSWVLQKQEYFYDVQISRSFVWCPATQFHRNFLNCRLHEHALVCSDSLCTSPSQSGSSSCSSYSYLGCGQDQVRTMAYRARILTLLRSPGIDSNASAPPAFVAWRAGTITLIPTRFLAPIDCLKIPAQETAENERMNGDVVKKNSIPYHTVIMIDGSMGGCTSSSHNSLKCSNV